MRDHLVRYIYRKPEPYYAFMFALLIAICGFWLCMPFASFTFPHYFSHYVWGGIGLFFGLSEILLYWKGNELYLYAILGQFFFWIFYSSASCLNHFGGIGWLITLWLSVMVGLGYINRKFYDSLDINK